MMSEVEYNKKLREIYNQFDKDLADARARKADGIEKLRTDYDKELNEARARKTTAIEGLRKELRSSRDKVP